MDNILNRITMYRLVLYVLCALWVVAFLLVLFNFLPFSIFWYLAATVYIVFLCYIFNKLFSYLTGAYTNIESVYITALILFFLITPPGASKYDSFLIFAFLATFFAMGSKYVVLKNSKHIFNPVAVAFVLTGLIIGNPASWWIGGHPVLIAATFLFGIMIVRKIRRADLVISFFATLSVVFLLMAWQNDQNIFSPFISVFKNSFVAFLAFIMLTEPLTTPPTRFKRIVYGGITAVLTGIMLKLGTLLATPEMALVLANFYSYLIGNKIRLKLKLIKKEKVASDTFNFIFSVPQKINYLPGQYLEWTLPPNHFDNRGNRRYFTIASSPTEKDIILGAKFYSHPSSFKQHLFDLKEGDYISATALAGDFVLPENSGRKLAFLAGGIGVTPFRSIIKTLLDKNEKRDIIFFFSNKTEAEIAYKELFDEAAKKLGVKMVYALTSPDVSESWTGERHFVNEQMIRKYAPDFEERAFYISGPQAMVSSLKATLISMGVPRKDIKTDYFPGLV